MTFYKFFNLAKPYYLPLGEVMSLPADQSVLLLYKFHHTYVPEGTEKVGLLPVKVLRQEADKGIYTYFDSRDNPCIDLYEDYGTDWVFLPLGT